MSNFKKIMGKTLQTSLSLAGGTNSDVIKYTIPSTLVGRITKRHLYVNNNGALGFITWTIKKNQNGVQPYDGMKDITPMPVDVNEDYIDFQPTSELEVNIANSDAGAWTAGILLQLDLGIYI